MKLIKTSIVGLFVLCGLGVALTLVHGQESPMAIIQIAPLSLTPTDLQTFRSLSEAQVTALVSALDATPTIPADALPRSGTFWALANRLQLRAEHAEHLWKLAGNQ